MPLYTYKCHSCRAVFEVRHGMFFEEQRCVKCYSDDVFRLPSEVSVPRKEDNNKTSAPGKIVDKYIEDTKREIKEEKKKLSSKEL